MEHSQKMQMAESDLSYHCNLLMNEYGEIVTVNSYGHKRHRRHQVVRNFNVEKTYKQRRNARKYVKKLLTSKINNS
jgi:hypothetical protein